MQEQKKANVLPGQVTLEDVEREAEKETWQNSVVEIRMPGKETMVYNVRSFVFLFIEPDAPDCMSSIIHSKGIDNLGMYEAVEKTYKKYRAEMGEIVDKLRDLKDSLDGFFEEDEKSKGEGDEDGKDLL